jgi:hypothetical protein
MTMKGKVHSALKKYYASVCDDRGEVEEEECRY